MPSLTISCPTTPPPPAAADPAASLAHRQSASQQTRAERITENLPLVRYVVSKLRRFADQNPLLDYDDLLAFGAEGLIAAVDTFEPERGLQFSTWAVMKIRGAVLDALRALDPLSRGLRAKSRAIDQATADLAHRTGQWPRRAEIAAALGESVAQLDRELQDIGRVALSLDRRRAGGQDGEDDPLDLYDRLADTDPAGDPAASADRQALGQLLRTAVAALPPREWLLITRHYGNGQSLQSLAPRLGVSSSRMSQLHARALRLLRARLEAALADPVPAVPASQPRPAAARRQPAPRTRRSLRRAA